MTELSNLDVDTEALCVRASRVDVDGIQLALTGSAETPAYEALMTLVRRLQARAHAQRPSEVVVDLRELEFMNSTCIKTFVTWLSELRDADAVARYPVRFVFDPSKPWQRRTVGALKSFAPSVVIVAD
ncbi:MAG TPA: hypothetical protein VKP14_00390 [Gaiellaceae bacterium]|nr:hypothetical protein [Gaiellaceae bacterium]